MLTRPLSFKGEGKIPLFRFTLGGRRTLGRLCLGHLPAFWNRPCGEWRGMGKGWFSNRVLESYRWREGINWRGIAMIWENNYFWSVGTRAWITDYKRKPKSRRKLSCRFVLSHKWAPRPPLFPLQLVPLTKTVCNISLLMFLRWWRGLLHLFHLTLISRLSVIS